MSSTVRVRFAPAPTGLLHIGNARTALFNYIFAKREKGRFILRIEDTDRERSSETFVQAIMEDLRWLGIEWDEGPDGKGEFGPYRQSQRISLYRQFAQQLLREGKAYKCFCSRERLEALRKEQLSRGLMPRYDGRCRLLTKKELSEKESEGSPFVLRFPIGKGTVSFEDLIHGKMSFELSGIGDFIIIRSDGVADYNFACVIDDHLMEITHVIRGDDHLSNTPRQILLYQAFGWRTPLFAHHPLILGPDRTPLSKRHGATSVSQYREEGYLPEALLNYLFLLGWTPSSKEEIFSQEKLREEFSLSSLSRNAPIHSPKKLDWLNSYYIRKTEAPRLLTLLTPYLGKAGIRIEEFEPKYLLEVVSLLKENLVVLSQVEEYLGVFFDEKFKVEEDAKKVLQDPENRKILQEVCALLKESIEKGEESWTSLLSKFEERTGKRGKSLYVPLRAGITGKMKGPELVKILPLLGKKRVIKRLKMALEGTES